MDPVKVSGSVAFHGKRVFLKRECGKPRSSAAPTDRTVRYNEAWALQYLTNRMLKSLLRIRAKRLAQQRHADRVTRESARAERGGDWKGRSRP
jgi:hypothetical protein